MFWQTEAQCQTLGDAATGGQWLPDVKQLAGGSDEWQQPGDPPLRISWDQVSFMSALPLELASRCYVSSSRNWVSKHTRAPVDSMLEEASVEGHQVSEVGM